MALSVDLRAPAAATAVDGIDPSDSRGNNQEKLHHFRSTVA